MANICKTTITVIGLKEAPEAFVKALSKAMFSIDLDNLEPKWWAEDDSVDGRTWYGTLVDDYRRQGHAQYCILYPMEPYEKLGVAVPRFYVETKWVAPAIELSEASKLFPELTFHLDWWIHWDGPSGEVVIRNDEYIDELSRPASGLFLFDYAVLYPKVSLLPAHLPYTLAQRAALRLEDTISIIDRLIHILDDERFTNSPFTGHRDAEKTAKHKAILTALRASILESAKELDFEGVFLEREADAMQSSTCTDSKPEAELPELPF